MANFTLLGHTFNDVAGFKQNDTGQVLHTFEEGGSSYELIASTEVTVSTTSTSATSVKVWTVPIYPAAKGFFLFRIRDKAGARNGYFYGSDSYFFPYKVFNGGSGSSFDSYGARIIINKTTSGIWNDYSQGTSAGYGVYVREYSAIKSDSNTEVRIYSRYNSTYSKTIDGTYSVEWYYLLPPDGVTL